MEMSDEDFGDFGGLELFDFLELMLSPFANVENEGIARG